MKQSLHNFEFTVGFKVVKTIYANFTEARRIGDELSNEHGRDVVFKACNETLRRWDTLGTFIGNRRFVSALKGETEIISEDYTRMTRKEGAV